jgi:hypothetical protein
LSMARSAGEGHVINDILNTNTFGVTIRGHYQSSLYKGVTVCFPVSHVTTNYPHV